MAHTYCIDFTTTLSHCEAVEAENREQALELARKLLESELFIEYLIERWFDCYTYGGPNEPCLLEGEDALTASLDEEDISYYLGLED